MADEYYDGRKPAFDHLGRQRGFRSQRGAPMADLSKNIGGVIDPRFLGKDLPGLTPSSNWESMFHNFVTGGNTATGARAPQPTTSGSGHAGPVGTAGQALDLSIMAQPNGPTHQQRWSGAYQPQQKTTNPLAGTGYESGYAADIYHKYGTPGSLGFTRFGGEGAPEVDYSQPKPDDNIGTRWSYYPKGFQDASGKVNPSTDKYFSPGMGWEDAFQRPDNG